MRIHQSRDIHDYKLILEGLVNDWGYIYYRTILTWCNIIDEDVDHKRKFWQVWLVEHEGKNIGICGLWSQKENSIKELWLGWFGLAPEYRNLKIGGDVLVWMENYAKDIGCDKILSYVNKNSKPLNFYFRHGYKRICSVQEYLDNNPEASEHNFEDKGDHIIEKKINLQ